MAAYGVLMYVNFIFVSVFIGYSVGTAPLFGYNDGAHNHKELRNLFRKSLIIIGTVSVLMVGIAQAFARPLSWVFVGYDDQLRDMTVAAFRVFAISFLFVGFGIFSSGFFTALNDGLTSAAISILRTMVFQVAAVMIMPKILGLDGIWWSTVVAEALAMLLCVWFMFCKRKKYHY